MEHCKPCLLQGEGKPCFHHNLACPLIFSGWTWEKWDSQQKKWNTQKYTGSAASALAPLFCFAPDLTAPTVITMRRITNTHTHIHKRCSVLLLDSTMELCCHICNSPYFPSHTGHKLFHRWEVRVHRLPPRSPTAAPPSLTAPSLNLSHTSWSSVWRDREFSVINLRRRSKDSADDMLFTERINCRNMRNHDRPS